VGRVEEFQLGNHLRRGTLGKMPDTHEGGAADEFSDVIRDSHVRMLPRPRIPRKIEGNEF